MYSGMPKQERQEGNRVLLWRAIAHLEPLFQKFILKKMVCVEKFSKSEALLDTN